MHTDLADLAAKIDRLHAIADAHRDELEAYADRLFRPFERLSTHPTAGESSHGLGLSIVAAIVRAQ